MTVGKRCQIQPFENLPGGFFVFLSHADKHLVKHAFDEQLMSYILHDHVATVQPLPCAVGIPVDGDDSRVFFKPTKAARKGAFAGTVVTDNAHDSSKGKACGVDDNKSVFLSAGQISLTEKFAQSQYVYPGGLYEGIELFIDPEVVCGGVAVLWETFGLHIEELCGRYCPGGDTFIAELPLADELLKKLYVMQSEDTPVGRVGMQTGVIDLLAMLLYDRLLPKEGKSVYYTRFQVEIARQIESILSADLSRSHTVRKFSDRFDVNESSIKNYFFGVFGQNISRKPEQICICFPSGIRCISSPVEYRKKKKVSGGL